MTLYNLIGDHDLVRPALRIHQDEVISNSDVTGGLRRAALQRNLVRVVCHVAESVVLARVPFRSAVVPRPIVAEGQHELAGQDFEEGI